MSLLRRLLPAALSFAAAAQAATVWDEGTQGDLSGNGLAPTPVALQPGSNLLLGSTGRGSAGVDRDYFVFTLADGFQLDAVTLLEGSTFLGQQSLSFIGVQAGPQVTVSPTSGSATGADSSRPGKIRSATLPGSTPWPGRPGATAAEPGALSGRARATGPSTGRWLRSPAR